MGIFSENAPRLWAAGLPAIPLRAGFKAPAISAWQVYADRMPTKEEQSAWLGQWGEGNIGMPMGPASGLVAIDIDSEDPRVLRVIDAMLPKSPWTRVGRKGAVYVYRFEGQRTFRIKGADGNMIMECLSKGTQIVLPPSIHPDTLMPYTANCPLEEIVKVVPTLPRNVEQILREALKASGIEVGMAGQTKIASIVPAGARDNALVYHAGLLARAVVKGERSLMEAMGEIKEWVETYPEKVAGDDVPVDKAQLKIVDFLRRDVLGEKRNTLPAGWDNELTDEDKKNLGVDFDDQMEQWGCQRVLDYLEVEFTKHVDPRSQGWIMAIETVLDRIARHPDFGVLDEGRVLGFIVNQSKSTVTKADLKKRVNELKAGEIDGTDHSQIAKAMISDLEMFGELRFYLSTFWQWKGANWEKLEQTVFLTHLADNYSKYPACRKYSDHGQIVRLASGLLTGSLAKRTMVGVNFANGFLTEDLELIAHSPDFGMTYVLPYRYQTSSHCPLFMQMLSDSWGEDPDYGDKVMALQEALAATLMGLAPRYQRAVCLIGLAHSGKSRIVEILKGLMPEGCHSAVSPSDWGDKFMPAQMVGKLLNLAGEISETRPISGEVFKQVVEGAEIEAQFKNQPIFRFRPTCAQWFASNHLPKTKDTSEGFNRRWLMLEFPRKISNEKKVIDIDQIILAQEREQIVAWAMQGLDRLRANKDYTLPTSHLAMIDDMANSNNSVRYFLSANPRLKIGRAEHEGTSQIHITGDHLYDEYYSFSRMAGGVSPVPRGKFHTLMKELAPNFAFEQLKTTERSAQTFGYTFITLANGRK